MGSKGSSGGNGWKWAIVAAVVLAALAMGRVLTAPEERGGRAAGKGKGGRQLEVNTMVLRPETVARRIQSSGTVMAREEVDLRSETDGRVTGIHFREGTPVRKGALLVKVNDAELRAQLRQVEHRVKLAEEREARQRALLERQAVSQEEYDVALQERNSLLAERDLLRARLDKTEIRAPFDGVVGLKSVSVGSYVSPGTRIAGFVSVDPLRVDFSIPEQYFSQVKAGDSLSLTVDGLKEAVKGVVHAVEPKVDPATRMLRIRAECPNEKGLIPPGASARVDLPLRASEGVIMAPSQAVLPDIRGQKVMLYKGGKARSVPVTAGFRTEDRVQIDGVSPGDTLITSGLVQVKDGMDVAPAGPRPVGGAGAGGEGA
jgi:membrane fusion protein (multidrug efflux system)